MYDDATDPDADVSALAPRVDPQDTTPGKPQGELVVAGDELPPRPALDPAVSGFVKDLWNETRNLPAFDEAVKAAREAQKTLFPAWHDRGDKWYGKVPKELRSRKEDRLVRTPLIYLNQKQSIAQTVPEDHEATWKPREQVKPREDQDIVASDVEERWADTIRIATKEYLREARVQEWLEALVQDAKSYPAAVLKITFQRDWTMDPLNGDTSASSNDEQDTIQRIRVLTEEVARGNITKEDPRWIELHQMVSTTGGKSELQLWRRLRISVIPINCFRAPDACRDPLNVYEQPWLADDQELTPVDLRARFPFKQQTADDGTPGEWTGIHPEDMEAMSKERSRLTGTGIRSNDLKRRSTRRGATGRDAPVKATVTVCEVWHRQTNTVYVLAEGIPYPIAKWVPERQPEQWFPYIVVVPNRISNDLYGISDVELQADTQARINRKRTDLEKARWIGMPRDFFDSSLGDEAAIRTALKEARPGEATGLPLGGKPLNETIQRLTYDVKPDAFDTSGDEQELRMEARLSEQSLGVTGRAKFAAEVDTANLGNEISVGFDQNIYRRVLERVYDMAAQILIYELDADDWQDVAGPYALVPELATEAEVRAAHQQIRQEAQQQATAQVLQALQPNPATGMPNVPPELATPWGTPDPVAIKRAIQTRATDLGAQLCQLRYGPEGPYSREGLYRRLRCQVELSINGSVDRDRRIKALLAMASGLEQAAQAAQIAGTHFDAGPWIRRFAQLTGEQQNLDAMFSTDPNKAAESMVQMLAQGKQLDPQTIGVLMQVLMPIMQQFAAQQAAAAGAAPGGVAGASDAGAPAGGGPAPSAAGITGALAPAPIPGPGAGGPAPGATLAPMSPGVAP